MRPKEMRCVAAFYTTAAAMATEQACRKQGLPGRLIPVPRSITSDCGIAWSAPAQLRDSLEALLAQQRIETAGLYDLLL